MTAATHPPRSRTVAVGAAALWVLLSGAAFAQGLIVISPGYPASNQIVSAFVGPTGYEFGPCVAWRVAESHGHSIRLEGEPLAGTCAPASVGLGKLSAGHYTVTARMAGVAEPYAEARFDVLSPGEIVEPRTVDVALERSSPRAGQPTGAILSITTGPCEQPDFSAPPTIVDDRIVFEGDLGSCPFEPPGGLKTTGFRHVLPGLTAGDKTIEVRSFSHTVATFGFHVDADTTALTAAGGRFRITLRWTDHAGVAHDATATRLTEESGQFWFFDPSNPEVTVKVVDGTGLNDAWWVFVSSMTDLGFTITVEGKLCSAPGAYTVSRQYTQSAGHNRNFIDTSAFAEDPSCPQ